METSHTTKAVLALSSHVARGSVGLRAAGFAIERLGLPVWKVPTIWMPWHPGHTKRFGMPPRNPTPDAVFAQSLDALVGTPVVGEVGAVLTGYFASSEQINATCRAIDALRQRDPSILVVCDPVSADAHGTYVPPDVVGALRDALLPRADVITPNRFEAAAFAGQDVPSDNTGLVRIANILPCDKVVVTSAYGMMKNAIGALLVDGHTAMLAEHSMVANAPHGTGDMFAALVCAHLVSGLTLDVAVMRATSSVFEMVARSVQAGGDELLLAAEQASLVSPMAMVTQRHLAVSKKAS